MSAKELRKALARCDMEVSGRSMAETAADQSSVTVAALLSARDLLPTSSGAAVPSVLECPTLTPAVPAAAVPAPQLCRAGTVTSPAHRPATPDCDRQAPLARPTPGPPSCPHRWRTPRLFGGGSLTPPGGVPNEPPVGGRHPPGVPRSPSRPAPRATGGRQVLGASRTRFGRLCIRLPSLPRVTAALLLSARSRQSTRMRASPPQGAPGVLT